jgi:hypothetical protein
MKSLFKMDNGGGIDMNQIVSQIAQMLQNNQDPSQLIGGLLQQMAPEQVVQVLTQAGLPQEQAVQMIQQMAQQMQQQQPDPAQQQMQGQQQMALGGEMGVDPTTPPAVDPATKNQATMDWLNSNPYQPGKKPLKLNSLEPVKVNSFPSLRSNVINIPGGGSYGKDQYQLVEMPPDYKGHPIYLVKGKPVVVDESFNKEYFNMYQNDKLLGPGELIPIYGRGTPYMENGGDMNFSDPYIKELKKELSSSLALPHESSDKYVNDRFAIFQEAVRRNFAKSVFDNKNQNQPAFAANGIDMSQALSDLNITQEQYNSNPDYKNRVDDYMTKSTSNPISSPSSTASGRMYSEEEVKRLISNFSNQPAQKNQFFTPGPQNIPYYGYQDPRTQTPSVNAFGRIIQGLMNPSYQFNSPKVKFDGVPNDIDINSIIQGTNPNYSIDNIETFKKGLFNRKTGVRLNLNSNQVGQNQQQVDPSQLENNYYKGVPMSEQEALYRQQMDASNEFNPVMNNDMDNQFDYVPNNNSFGLPAAQNGIDLTFKPDYNINSSDVADVAKNSVDLFANLMNKAREFDPSRQQAFYSSMNQRSVPFNEMSRGLYTQQGDFIPTDIGNQVLNPTNAFSNSFNIQMLSLGGDVDLSPEEENILRQSGYNIKRKSS